jgi:2-oxoglutarate ferredoxin oxidoreductase subunit alpha
MQETIAVDEVVVLFAGDSGDGMQLTGNQFTNTSAVFGNDVSTFPNFPAEIRAPQGTVGGVSGFQVKFGSHRLYTPGDEADVLVVMNAAALVANIHKLKKGGVLIANLDGFDPKNLKLAGCQDENPLETDQMHDFNVQSVNITKLTVEALIDTAVPRKEAGRSKNMFVLGLLYWMYNRSMEPTENFIKNKFKKKPELVEANLKVLRTGYHFGETSEAFASRYSVKPAQLEPGVYRNIMGNQATAIGLVAAAKKAGLELFFGTYPITPASDILHELSRHRNFGVKTFQAEDEIAAVAASIGASFGGSLGVTSSSGPGIALKTEAMGLATILEIPLVVINVQRGGPSTGLPTKTEQADLFQALYGRNGEAQIPVICAHSPYDAFEAIFEATRIAVEYMTPVMFLSDGYIANGAEPWKFPKAEDLPEITHRKITETDDEKYLPYKRDEKLVRTWAVPGTAGLEHRIGGLEKDDLTGNVSYDPDNHEHMVKIRAEKISRMAEDLPLQEIHQGGEKGKVLVLGWGSTYGAIQTAVAELVDEELEVGHAHLRYVSPLPKNLGEILASYDEVVIPEMNDGQLVNLIQAKYLKKCRPLKKIKGIPFTAKEIKEFVISIYQAS